MMPEPRPSRTPWSRRGRIASWMAAVSLSLGALALLTVVAGTTWADWRQFRGPGGLAVSTETGLPVTWSKEENVVWQKELPGAGTSSPIILGDRVYVTCYSGYGMEEDNPGDDENLMRHLVCLNRTTGDIVWQKEFKPVFPESRYQGNGARHGYSSSTPATDGTHLFVFFGKSGVFAFDLEGNEQWHQNVGDRTDNWGSSNSPVLYKDLVIINAAVESGAIVAFHKQTGEQAWKVEGIRRSWNTPILVELPDGATELVVAVPDKLLGFNPETGEQLWTADGINDYVCPSMVAHDGVVYAIGGRRSTAVAVRCGGRGNVTETHVLWRTNKGANVSSPVYHEGHLYWVHERGGTAYCLNAENGDTVYEKRIEPRPGTVYSSAMVADGKLYVVSQHNGTFVLAAKPEYELLAHNQLDDARANASPAIDQGQIFLRSDKYLYCIGKK